MEWNGMEWNRDLVSLDGLDGTGWDGKIPQLCMDMDKLGRAVLYSGLLVSPGCRYRMDGGCKIPFFLLVHLLSVLACRFCIILLDSGCDSGSGRGSRYLIWKVFECMGNNDIACVYKTFKDPGNGST
jgi:hypothetical protein